MTTTVVNIRREPCDVYIGRAGKGQDGYFGNPFRLSEHGPAAMLKFRAYFLRRIETDRVFRFRVLALRGKRLGCFCVPDSPCHGQIIAEWIDAQPEGGA